MISQILELLTYSGKSNIDTSGAADIIFSCLLCLCRQRLQKIYTSSTVLQDVDGFTNSLYCIDEAVGDEYMGYVQRGYNDPKTLFAVKRDFFAICHQWMTDNHPKIESIFKALYA